MDANFLRVGQAVSCRVGYLTLAELSDCETRAMLLFLHSLTGLYTSLGHRGPMRQLGPESIQYHDVIKGALTCPSHELSS